MVADDRPVVLYCRNCAVAVILQEGQQLATCKQCKSQYFGNEPPKRRPVHLVISENDRRFLRSIKTAWLDEPPSDR